MKKDEVLQILNLGKSYHQYAGEYQRIRHWFGLSANYQQHWVLKNLSLTLKKGEALGVVGANGAGKSTLLKLITGITTPTTGKIISYGSIAAILELSIGFNPDFTGLQNVIHLLSLMGHTKEEIEQVIPEIENFANIKDYFQQPLRVYSSGMQVRLAFATATAFRPDLLIIDEALAVGDASFQAKCFRRINHYQQQGTTLLLVSHDLNQIKKTCNRAIVINEGHLVFDGHPEQACDYYYATLADVIETEQKTDQSSANFSCGIGEVEITSAYLSVNDQKTRQIETSQRFSIHIKAKANKKSDNLCLGYMIRDKNGVDLFGSNTAMQGLKLHLKKDQEKELRFSLTNNLGAGDYFLTFAIHDEKNHLANVQQWSSNMLSFSVTQKGNSTWVGDIYMSSPSVELLSKGAE